MTVHMPPEGDESAAARWREVSLMLLESIEPLNGATLKETA
jgi:hypothetical protein